MHFLENKNYGILIQISLKSVSKDPIGFGDYTDLLW